MNIFIGTEFTAYKDAQLISLGMVCEKRDDFYAEVRYSPPLNSELAKTRPSDGKIALALVDPDMLYQAAIGLMEGVRKRDEGVFICTETALDLLLFCAALKNHIPPWCYRKNIAHEIVQTLRDQYKPRSFDLYAVTRAKANRHAHHATRPKLLVGPSVSQ